MESHLKTVLSDFAVSGEHLTVLTGAGISAESGIPTFRGKNGYWTVGSEEYHPQEVATYRMFSRKPLEVWQWYVYRIGVCYKAQPNPGHMALVELETLFQNRFTLITQNVDNLHIFAGNKPENTLQIHGNIFFMRCSKECSKKVYPVPDNLTKRSSKDPIRKEDRSFFLCPSCNQLCRPHVLWFDETYNEEYFKLLSAIKIAQKTGLLITVGTSGATNLPNQIVREVLQKGGIIVDINIEENTFSSLALAEPKGFFMRESAGQALPAILDIFRETAAHKGQNKIL